MLNDITRNRLVGMWFAAVALVIAFVVAMGVNVTASTTALLLTLSLVPRNHPGLVARRPSPDRWRGSVRGEQGNGRPLIAIWYRCRRRPALTGQAARQWMVEVQND